MDLVKLEIDGKRIIADNRQTILEVARANDIGNIPTLCHDGRLEPFASCYLCVVKVKGARTLLPACSTKVSAGMIVETESVEVRRSRKAALELLLSNHHADCVGPCQLACPAGVDVQGYIALAALGRHRDAIRLIKERNPLPAVCGRVCTRPCEVSGCRRNLLDDPVGIDSIKRYLADLDLEERQPFRPAAAPPNGRKVAIVGAGPAGLSCAYYLALRGYAVQIFEALPEAGGMLRYGIPEYRLPKELLDLELSQILDLGITLNTNAALGRDFTVASLKESGFEAIFLGLGAWESSKMRVKDEEAEGVLAGIDFLKQVGLRRPRPLHGRVLVVGGGNTAIDCARSALRLGAREVRILYRRTRTEMPANAVEIDEAGNEGVEMDFLVAPVRVVTSGGRVTAVECVRMELGEPDASGRRSPKPLRGSEFTVDCDFVIAAIGQATKVQELVDGRVERFLPFGEVLNLTRWQTIQVEGGTFETSVEGVFSGGDVVTGAATAIEAIAAGRKAAHAIDRYITTGRAEPERVEVYSRKEAYRVLTPADLNEGPRYPRRPMPVLPPEERSRSFVEVELGYGPEDVRKESHRCLECGCSALFECDLRRFATEYGADISTFMGEAKEHRIDRSHPLLEIDLNKCILCGRCVRICSEIVGIAAYGFVNRGFDTVVKPAPGGSLLDTECVTCGLCASTCPTGAIVERLQLAKPGPWNTSPVPSVCPYCGVGCRIDYRVYGESLVTVSPSVGGGVSSGDHCRKGRFGYGYAQATDRLKEARLRAGREQQVADLEEALRYAGMRLKELGRRYSGEEIAVFVSPRMTNEEIYLAQKLARVALRTNNVTSFAHLARPEALCPEVMSTVSYADLADAQAILVVNSNLDEEHFVADLVCKRAIRKGARLLYVGPGENRTSRFAHTFLRCHDGAQGWAVLGLLKDYEEAAPGALDAAPDLRRQLSGMTADRLAELSGVDRASSIEAARVLAGSLLKIVLFNTDYPGLRTAGDNRIFASAGEALGCGLLALRERSNMQGLLDMGASPRWLPGYVDPAGGGAALEALEKHWCVVLRDLEAGSRDVARLLKEKKIKVAVVLGEDPLGCEGFPVELRDGLIAVDFLVGGDLFETATTRAANVVLPLSAPPETSGTMTNHERRVQKLSRAIPPPAGMETWQILCRLAAHMGYRFRMRYDTVDDVTGEIRRVVPIYGNVTIDAVDSEGIWDRNGCNLEHPPVDLRSLETPYLPAPTLRLDPIETRFACWFDELLERARHAHAAAAV